jgi:hypothetical protein
MASRNVYSPSYDDKGNPKPSIPELKDAIENARLDAEDFAQQSQAARDDARAARDDSALARDAAKIARDDAEQTAIDLGVFGGVDDTVQTIGDLPASDGDNQVFYVLDESRYYEDTGSGPVAGGWEKVGPNISLDATQIGHVVSMPRSADSKVFVAANFASVEDAIQAAIDYAGNNGGGRVLQSESLLPVSESMLTDDPSVARDWGGAVPDPVDRGFIVVRNDAETHRVFDPLSFADHKTAIQEAADYIKSNNFKRGTIYLPGRDKNGNQITIDGTIYIGYKSSEKSHSLGINVLMQGFRKKEGLQVSIDNGDPAFDFNHIQHSVVRLALEGTSSTNDFVGARFLRGSIFNDVKMSVRRYGGGGIRLGKGVFGCEFSLYSRALNDSAVALNVSPDGSGAPSGNNDYHIMSDGSHSKIIYLSDTDCPNSRVYGHLEGAKDITVDAGRTSNSITITEGTKFGGSPLHHIRIQGSNSHLIVAAVQMTSIKGDQEASHIKIGNTNDTYSIGECYISRGIQPPPDASNDIIEFVDLPIQIQAKIPWPSTIQNQITLPSNTRSILFPGGWELVGAGTTTFAAGEQKKIYGGNLASIGDSEMRVRIAIDPSSISSFNDDAWAFDTYVGTKANSGSNDSRVVAYAEEVLEGASNSVDVNWRLFRSKS